MGCGNTSPVVKTRLGRAEETTHARAAFVDECEKLIVRPRRLFKVRSLRALMTMNRCSGHLVISFGRLLHMPQAIQLTKSQSKWSAPTNNYAARLCTHEAHQAKQTPLPTELRPVLASYG